MRSAVCRAGRHDQFLVPARRVQARRAGHARQGSWPHWPRHCRPQLVAGVVRAHIEAERRMARKCSMIKRPSSSRWARGWFSPMARPTFWPIRKTAPPGAGSPGCSPSAKARGKRRLHSRTAGSAGAIEGLNLIVMPPARIDAERLVSASVRLKEAAPHRSGSRPACFIAATTPAARAACSTLPMRRFRAADRRQRRALSCARTPRAAGCRDLHPRASDAGGRRPPARSQCRAASEIAEEMARLFGERPEAIGQTTAFSRALPLLAR